MGLNTLNCIECGKTAPRLKKNMCNTCYERIRLSNKPKIELICEKCGPVVCKKLTRGLCSKCYQINRDPAVTQECKYCNKVKTNIFVKDLCQACYSNKHRSDNPSIYTNSRKKHKDDIAKNGRNWRIQNPGKKRAKDAKYRATKLKATPKWTNLEVIVKIYENCPSDKTVDHIIPLQGENISGLHVPWNLQYLTPSENSKKSNKFDGTPDNNGWRNK